MAKSKRTPLKGTGRLKDQSIDDCRSTPELMNAFWRQWRHKELAHQVEEERRRNVSNSPRGWIDELERLIGERKYPGRQREIFDEMSRLIALLAKERICQSACRELQRMTKRFYEKGGVAAWTFDDFKVRHAAMMERVAQISKHVDRLKEQ